MLELFYRSLVTFTFTFLPHTHLLKELKKKKKKDERNSFKLANENCTV